MPLLDRTKLRIFRGNEEFTALYSGGKLSWRKPTAQQRVVNMDRKLLGLAVPRNDLSVGGTAWLDAMVTAGAKAIRFDFYFDQIQTTQGGAYTWNSVDSLVTAARARGLHILGILTGTRAGAGQAYDNAADRTAFAQFAAAAVTKYKGVVDYWAIYNEPNNGKMSAANYTALLQAVGPAIRAASPVAFIVGPNMSSVAGPTTGLFTNNAEFLNTIYDAGAHVHFDALAFHPYTYPYWPDEPDAFLGWNQLKNVLRPLMVSRGDGAKKIWLTEVGYPSGPTAIDEWYTEDYQRDVLDLYLDEYKTAALDYCGPMFWYSWQDRAELDSTEDFFGLRRPDEVNKPAYTRFQAHATSFPALTV